MRGRNHPPAKPGDFHGLRLKGAENREPPEGGSDDSLSLWREGTRLRLGLVPATEVTSNSYRHPRQSWGVSPTA